MCGRFTLATTPDELQIAFPFLSYIPAINARYNIAPSQQIAVISNYKRDRIQFFSWGLIPHWSKDKEIGFKLINARSETLSQKPSFKHSFKKRRCLIPATGFYEWKTASESSSKIPVYFQLNTGDPFAFAGLWDSWRSEDNSEIMSTAIITTTPNDLVSGIHNRMPAILDPQQHITWLDPDVTSSEVLNSCLKPFPSDLMKAFEVSKLVNNPVHDSMDLIQPVQKII